MSFLRQLNQAASNLKAGFLGGIMEYDMSRFDPLSSAEKWDLKPAIQKASEEMLNARLALFKEGILTTPDDIEKLKKLKAEIDGAADTQAMILSAIKLAALLGVFVA